MGGPVTSVLDTPDGQDYEFYGDQDPESFSTADGPNMIFCYSKINYGDLQNAGYPSMHVVNWFFSTSPDNYGKGEVLSNEWYGGGDPNGEFRFTTTLKYVNQKIAYVNYDLNETFGSINGKLTITSQTKWEGDNTYSSVMKWKRLY